MLTFDDLELDLAAYAARRPEERARMIALKRHRRVPLGDIVTVLFENRETLRFQVQEMLLVEEITDPAGVEEELAVYNPLLPTADELSATLFIEIPDLDTLKRELPRLVGIEHSLALVVGGERVPARGEEGRSRDDYTSTVHYVRFPLPPGVRERFCDPDVPVELAVDHPNYSDAAPIAGEVRRSLVADLAV